MYNAERPALGRAHEHIAQEEGVKVWTKQHKLS
jgi:hypothetical protein